MVQSNSNRYRLARLWTSISAVAATSINGNRTPAISTKGFVHLFEHALIPLNDHPTQFKITRASSLGYYICHAGSGRYVTVDPSNTGGDGRAYTNVRERFGTVFAFEDMGDGTVM